MYKRKLNASAATALVALAIWIAPLAAYAQTGTIQAPKNKYSVQDDIKLGNQAANEVERQFPLINDADAEDYITRVGDRLVGAIPSYLQHPEFQYRFKWVNASDINAFALPGGPMYINRGMIENARNEGELAGVMAHELSHVALRHATAQATKQSSAGSTLRNLGLILGGAVLGGQAGAELGAVFAQGWALKYSREYESQADALGARIMARAGYDPHDLANVFQTIAKQGSSGPQWLSSHPDPGNRYQTINRMADQMRVENPIKITRDFSRTVERFRSMPRARSMSEIEKGAPAGNGGYGNNNPYGNGRYSSNVELPSTRTRYYSGLNWISLSIPSNWQDFSSGDGAVFAPAGASGDQGITHGLMVGTYNGRGTLNQDMQGYINEILQGNNYLRQQGSYQRTYLAGRQGYSVQLAGRSPITGRTELVTVYAAELRDGRLAYLTTVVPQNQSYQYSSAFNSIISSVRFAN